MMFNIVVATCIIITTIMAEYDYHYNNLIQVFIIIIKSHTNTTQYILYLQDIRYYT